MIALDLDHPVFDRAAGTAFLLKLLGKLLQGICVQGQAGNQRHSAALAPFGFPADSDDTVAFGCAFIATAGTVPGRMPASGAETPPVGRINQPALFIFLFSHNDYPSESTVPQEYLNRSLLNLRFPPKFGPDPGRLAVFIGFPLPPA